MTGGASGSAGSLDIATRSRLVRLKTFLLDAQRRAADTTEPGRHLAVVALDGVCENALYLAVNGLGVDLKPRADFPEMEAKLRVHLAERWDRSGWAGVRAMHRVRNLAQHEGVLPDVEQVRLWTIDTERFVRSLVGATFHLELLEITLASAIDHHDVRACLEQAERAVAAGDGREGFDSAARGFDLARRAWRAQRGGAGATRGLPPKFQDLETADYVRSSIAWLDELSEVAVFALDMSEYHWLDAAIGQHQSPGPPPTTKDARRALLFSFEWVLRWESFSSRYPGARWREWYAQPAPRTGTEPRTPAILRVVVSQALLRYGDRHLIEYEVQLADLPDDEATWRSGLQDALLGSAPALSGHLGPGGSLTLRADASVGPETLMNKLRTAMATADAHYDERLASGAAWFAEADRLQREYDAAFAGSPRQRPPRVGAVSIEPGTPDPGCSPPFELAVEFADTVDLDWRHVLNLMDEQIAASNRRAGWREGRLVVATDLLDPAHAPTVIAKALDGARERQEQERRDEADRLVDLRERQTALDRLVRPQ
jgi:hypothetical protein